MHRCCCCCCCEGHARRLLWPSRRRPGWRQLRQPRALSLFGLGAPSQVQMARRSSFAPEPISAPHTAVACRTPPRRISGKGNRNRNRNRYRSRSVWRPSGPVHKGKVIHRTCSIACWVRASALLLPLDALLWQSLLGSRPWICCLPPSLPSSRSEPDSTTLFAALMAACFASSHSSSTLLAACEPSSPR